MGSRVASFAKATAAEEHVERVEWLMKGIAADERLVISG